MIKKAWSLRFSEVKAWLKELEFDKFDLVLMLLLFLMGRAHLPGGMVPFGLPALAAALMSARCKMIPGVSAAYFLAAALGTLTLGNGWQFFIFSISAVIFYAVMMFDTRVTESARTDNGKYKLPLGIKAGAVLLAAQPVPMIIAVSAGADNVKQAILLLFQAAIGFIAFYIFRTVVQVFSDNISRKLMSNEEMACLAITFAVLVLGLPDIVLLGLSLRRVICVSIIMIFAYRGGLGTGAACGITVGALLAASDMGEFSTVTVGLFGFCGFLSGLLNRFGKIGVGAGFLLGNLIFSPMVTMSADLIMSLFEIGFAITAFFILPEKATKFLKLPQLTGVHIPTVKVNYAEKLRNTAIARLSGFGEILREMSNVCVELTERQGGDPEKSDLMCAAAVLCETTAGSEIFIRPIKTF
jgi:stage II sporulation protein E